MQLKAMIFLRNIRYSIWLSLLGIFLVNAQEYTKVDAVAASYPSSFSSIEAFAQRLEKDFTTDADKVRAAYYWIANNIQYNYEILGSGRTGYPEIKIRKYTSTDDYYYQYYKAYASYALRYKLAVCAGYSHLLFYICEALNIEAKVIKGNVLQAIGEYAVIPNNTTHAWNAVFYNNQWNLIDATWSRDNNKDNPENVNFNGVYFNVPPERMILDHFPEDSKWQLLEKPITKKEFYTQPAVYHNFIAMDIEIDKKMRGLIKAKINDSITLRFTNIDTTKRYTYSFKRNKFATKFEVRKEGNTYIAKIPFMGTTKDILTIFADKNSIIRFHVTLTR
jgi:transglutaminase/protease-like cytokinesis protein 3